MPCLVATTLSTPACGLSAILTAGSGGSLLWRLTSASSSRLVPVPGNVLPSLPCTQGVPTTDCRARLSSKLRKPPLTTAPCLCHPPQTPHNSFTEIVAANPGKKDSMLSHMKTAIKKMVRCLNLHPKTSSF